MGSSPPSGGSSGATVPPDAHAGITDMAKRSSVLRASLWMLVLSALLFWVPTFGPLIAGYVGGRLAGSPGRGLLAALLPMAGLAVLVVVIFAGLALPVVGVVAGGTLAAVLLVQELGLVAGALIGGLLAG